LEEKRGKEREKKKEPEFNEEVTMETTMEHGGGRIVKLKTSCWEGPLPRID